MNSLQVYAGHSQILTDKVPIQIGHTEFPDRQLGTITMPMVERWTFTADLIMCFPDGSPSWDAPQMAEPEEETGHLHPVAT